MTRPRISDSDQLELFDAPSAGPETRRVRPSAPTDSVRRLARMLPRKLRLGTSSWSFPGWKDLVYADAADKTSLARHGLAAYGAHPLLQTVGLDRGYYAPLSVSDLRRYADAVPCDFRFVVKAASHVTSPVVRGAYGRANARNQTFLDAGWATDRIIEPYREGLGTRAGALLFQFPPLGASLTRAPRRFLDRLERFLEALPRGLVYAVELRDREFYSESYTGLLRRCGVQHCYSVHPLVPSLPEQRGIMGASGQGPLIVRWMLHAGLRYEEARRRHRPFDRLVDEDPETRETIAELVEEHLRSGRDVFVIANNKAEGSAPLSIFTLAETLARRLDPAALMQSMR